MSESYWWYLFPKLVKSWNSTTCFRNLTNKNQDLKALSSNAYLGWMLRFFGNDKRGFWKREARPICADTYIGSSTLKFFCLHIYVLSGLILISSRMSCFNNSHWSRVLKSSFLKYCNTYTKCVLLSRFSWWWNCQEAKRSRSPALF
jgi:hypothetical protein